VRPLLIDEPSVLAREAGGHPPASLALATVQRRPLWYPPREGAAQAATADVSIRESAMRAWLAIVFAAFMVLSPVASAPAGAEPTAGDVAAELNAYWANVFAENGRFYYGTSIHPVFDQDLTGCGFIDPYNFGPAAYCPANQVIYVSPLYIGPGGDTDLLYVAIAHEWGHHIEELLGFSPEPSMESELRTDCFAGAFLGDAVAQGVAPRGTYNGALYIMLLIGDPTYLPADMESHGTGSQRASSFNAGYSGGVGACGVGLS